MDSWQITLIVLIVLLFLNYIALRFILPQHIVSNTNVNEAFSNIEGFSGDSTADNIVTEELKNDDIYDKFYSKIYDQIIVGDIRTKTEVIYTLNWIKKYWKESKSLEILDIGCGTGLHVAEFSKNDVSKVVGVDRSLPMIERARILHPNHEYRNDDVENPRIFSAGEFNMITMYYFTIYYIHHKDQILKNIFNWLKPGGGFVVHIVNREKFDPILESASPFTGFSLQKYSKERVMKSKVTFDKFDYEAEFTIQDADAEFHETFKFKDGRKRKHIHNLHMPKIEKMVQEIESAGFTYKEFIDLTPIGYEYQFLFCFLR
jgi:ubiquinone/menaquinone biosynthesis C-methylase UbiE